MLRSIEATVETNGEVHLREPLHVTHPCRAIRITDADFATGTLARTNYARPGKLSSANASIMKRVVGSLTNEKNLRSWMQ